MILAAGAGRRMGGPKALLELDGETLLTRALRLYRRPALALRVAVLGCEAERARAAAQAEAEGVSWSVNEDWERGGMLSSVLRGLEAAERGGAEAILLHPVDHPAVDAATVDAVCAALAAGAALVVPVHEGRRGHPVGFSRALFVDLRAAPPGLGARAVVWQHADQVVEVRSGAGCRTSLDTPDDVARLGRPASA